MRNDFIQSSGWTNAQVTTVAGDASNRSYERLVKSAGHSVILMNAPPEKGEDVQPFVQILNVLRDNGLAAPELLRADIENGFLLLEDLGNDLFSHVCKTNPNIERALYRASIDVLLKLHKIKTPQNIAPYNLATYIREADLITKWYIPSATGHAVQKVSAKAYQYEISNTCNLIQNTAPVLVLRDYHAENLLWLPEREGLKKVGLLDFQDALIGHPAYDLVSLLEDARRDTSTQLQTDMKAYFIQNSNADPERFNYAYATIGAQRNLKIIGIFARLCVRDAKPQYVDLIPRVWAHLQHDLSHPNLQSLKNWVEKNVPEPTPQILTKIKEACHAA